MHNGQQDALPHADQGCVRKVPTLRIRVCYKGYYRGVTLSLPDRCVLYIPRDGVTLREEAYHPSHIRGL